MYHRFILAAILITTSLHAQAQKFVLNSLWRDSTIVIDGNPKDWDQPFRYYDSKAKIQYSVVNDDSNLYISLKTMDDKGEMKILRTGMDVWIDTTGKKKPIAVIHYPLPSETKLEWIVDPEDPEHQQLEKPDLKKLKTDYALSDKQIKFTGFKNMPGTIMPLENTTGVQVAIGWDRDNVFTYEVKLPFSSFYKEKLTAADAEKPITIGVEVHAFDVPQQIATGSFTDPSVSNSGMRNQGYSSTSNQGQPAPNMTMPKTNEMSQALGVQMRMKLAYK